MPEELPLTLFVIQVSCQRQEDKSNPYYSFVFRGKIRDFSPTLQSSSLALIWVYPSPQCEDFLGPRGGTHSEPMFSLCLDHIPDTQDPGIFYLNITSWLSAQTSTPGSSFWWTQGWVFTVVTWTKLKCACSGIQLCAQVVPCSVGWIQGWEKKESGT